MLDLGQTGVRRLLYLKRQILASPPLTLFEGYIGASQLSQLL